MAHILEILFECKAIATLFVFYSATHTARMGAPLRDILQRCSAVLLRSGSTFSSFSLSKMFSSWDYLLTGIGTRRPELLETTASYSSILRFSSSTAHRDRNDPVPKRSE